MAAAPVATDSGDQVRRLILTTLTDGTAAVSATSSFSKVTWTQSSVTLAAATSATLIASNVNRKALRWMVVGTNPMTVVPGAGPAVANAGINYSGNAGTGMQGGSEEFSGSAVSTQQFTAISTLGTTVIVWEGV